MTESNNTDLLKEFNEIIYSGRLHLNFGGDGTVEDLTDEEKLNLMKYIKKIKNKESDLLI